MQLFSRHRLWVLVTAVLWSVVQVRGAVERQLVAPAHVQAGVALDQHAAVHRDVLHRLIHCPHHLPPSRRRADVVRRCSPHLCIPGLRPPGFVPAVYGVGQQTKRKTRQSWTSRFRPQHCSLLSIHPISQVPYGPLWTETRTRSLQYFMPHIPPFPQIDIIGAMVIVWRARGKIIRSVLCSIV